MAALQQDAARLNGISRATLTRALKTLGDEVLIGGASRRTRYALRRPLRGNAAPIPFYCIDEHGQGHEIGQMGLANPGGSLLSFQEHFPWPLDRDMSDGWFEGLPYALFDIRPQGFIGRNFARACALDLGVSDNPGEWPDDDVAHVLATTGYDQPGDLILGEGAYRRFLDYFRTGAHRFLVESVWRQAAEAAIYFWNICAADTRIGADFRRICDDNGRNVAALLSRLR